MRNISDMSDKDKKRFYDKITPNPQNQCHEWTAHVNNTGYPYGRFTFDGKAMTAHRIAYQLHNNIDLPYGDRKVNVLHKCDNPRCCNPDHLFLGSHGDNMRDMAAKGRSGVAGVPPVHRGSDSKHAIVTEADIPTIRAEYAKIVAMPRKSGRMAALTKLGERFGLRRCSVESIGTRRNWKHVK